MQLFGGRARIPGAAGAVHGTQSVFHMVAVAGIQLLEPSPAGSPKVPSRKLQLGASQDSNPGSQISAHLFYYLTFLAKCVMYALNVTELNLKERSS